MKRAAPAQPTCSVCGKNAPFGFGPPLRRDRVWLCAAHKDRGAPRKGASGAARPAARKAGGGDLFGGA